MHNVPSSDLSAKSGLTGCRICGSKNIVKRGGVEFYTGYSWPVYDCHDCGCRFTPYDDDNAVHELLYSQQAPLYNLYTEYAMSCRALFDRGDAAGLRAELSKTSKYRFVVDQLADAPTNAQILEIGCSRGQLASYFILNGRNITGADVSGNAIASALEAFGDHFMLADDPRINARAPYDVIFHLGTIGCVADPIGMTRSLLNLLKPGGRLLFNAPNRAGCALSDQLWFESAPPPILVTMFEAGFWDDRFSDVAQANVEIEFCSPEQNLVIFLRRLARQNWRAPIPVALKDSGHPAMKAPRFGGELRRKLVHAVCGAASSTALDRLAPRHPTEYGLFVQMRKK